VTPIEINMRHETIMMSPIINHDAPHHDYVPPIRDDEGLQHAFFRESGCAVTHDVDCRRVTDSSNYANHFPFSIGLCIPERGRSQSGTNFHDHYILMMPDPIGASSLRNCRESPRSHYVELSHNNHPTYRGAPPDMLL
jgi:hypothetical protein